MLRIFLLGPLRLTWAGQDLPRPGRADVRQLLAYLLLCRDAPQPRRTIAGALWPEIDDASALTRLRRTLYRLQVSLPRGQAHEPGDHGAVPAWIDARRETLQWRGDSPYWLDVADLDRLDARRASSADTGSLAEMRQDLDEALALVGGSLLAGDEAEWIEPARALYAARHVQLLERRLEVCEAMGDLSAAIVSAERLIGLEPLHEAAHRHRMSLLCRQGNQDGAERAYEQYRSALLAEMDLEPRQETVELYEAIRAGRQGAGDVSRALASVDDADRALMSRLAELDDCFSLADALAAANAGTTGVGAKARLMTLIDLGLVVACCGSGQCVHYRVPVCVRANLKAASTQAQA